MLRTIGGSTGIIKADKKTRSRTWKARPNVCNDTRKIKHCRDSSFARRQLLITRDPVNYVTFTRPLLSNLPRSLKVSSPLGLCIFIGQFPSFLFFASLSLSLSPPPLSSYFFPLSNRSSPFSFELF